MIYNSGDVIISKKPHACKGNTWTVVRGGADYKLKCLTCGRYIVVTPDTLAKMIKQVKPNSTEK